MQLVGEGGMGEVELEVDVAVDLEGYDGWEDLGEGLVALLDGAGVVGEELYEFVSLFLFVDGHVDGVEGLSGKSKVVYACWLAFKDKGMMDHRFYGNVGVCIGEVNLLEGFDFEVFANYVGWKQGW